jgi:hypothetical protein
LVTYYLGQDKTYLDQQQKLTTAEAPMPPDAESLQIKERIANLRQPLTMDAKLARLRRDTELSQQQLAHKRLTAAQDVAWALINSPEFLYNH